MKLIIVRHGQTDHNKNKICQGAIDISLNEYGKNQALEVREILKDKQIDLVISSSLKRAQETAKIIAPNHDIILDDRIIERKLGIYEGKPTSSFLFHKYEDFHLNCCDDGVESIQTVYNRVKSILLELKEQYDDKTVLLITHASIFNVMHYYINGIPEDGICSFQFLANGKYIEEEI